MELPNMRELWKELAHSPAHWRHPGDYRAPHVVLRSGFHSDRFIDTLQYLSDVSNLIRAAQSLSRVIREKFIDQDQTGRFKGRPLWVFGSPMAGISLGTEVARFIGADHLGFTEKTPQGDLICRFDVSPGASILRIEEMTTTGGTPNRVKRAIIDRNPEADIIPVVGAYLIRCRDRPEMMRGEELLHCISLPKLGIESNEWKPEECPLCKLGSRPIQNPKQVWPDLLKTMTDPNHQVPATS